MIDSDRSKVTFDLADELLKVASQEARTDAPGSHTTTISTRRHCSTLCA